MTLYYVTVTMTVDALHAAHAVQTVETYLDAAAHLIGDQFPDITAVDLDSADEVVSADEDGEPYGSYDLSDDADALASAGQGMDEDYE